MSYLHFLIPPQKGIPILLFHQILPKDPSVMNTPPELFESYLSFLKGEGYQPVSLSQLGKIVTGEIPKLERAIYFTFDDGYLSQIKYAYPLLRKYGFKGSVYIIGDKLKEKSDEQTGDEEHQYADCSDLRNLDPEVMEIGLHSTTHSPFSKLSSKDMENEILKNISLCNKFKLPFLPYFAYPYGSRPGSKKQLNEMKTIFKNIGLKAAFRVGNSVQKLPVKDLYEIKRIHISGFDTIDNLKIKLKRGKLKPF
ncbi:MAG: polysaccharide deacetylase family protein [Bacteroidia bacterium]|nr:polysaccharide deacetylase family protein [Bacteroidia bacterium]